MLSMLFQTILIVTILVITITLYLIHCRYTGNLSKLSSCQHFSMAVIFRRPCSMRTRSLVSSAGRGVCIRASPRWSRSTFTTWSHVLLLHHHRRSYTQSPRAKVHHVCSSLFRKCTTLHLETFGLWERQKCVNYSHVLMLI